MFKPARLLLRGKSSSIFYAICYSTPILFQGFIFRSRCTQVFFKRVLLKQTPTQVFSCQICEFFENTFFYSTPPVAASVYFTLNFSIPISSAVYFKTMPFLSRKFFSLIFFKRIQFQSVHELLLDMHKNFVIRRLF